MMFKQGPGRPEQDCLAVNPHPNGAVMFTNTDDNQGQDLDALSIDLSDLDIEEIEILMQEGSTGMPDFGASCAEVCVEKGSSSCTGQ